MEERLSYLTDKNIYKAIYKLSIPVILGMIVQVFYNMADTFWVSFLSPTALAAVNVATPIFLFFLAISAVLGTGGGAAISRYLGSNKRKKAGHAFLVSLFWSIFISIIITIFGLIFLDKIVEMLGAHASESATMFLETKRYVFVIVVSFVGIMLNYVLSQLLRSEGATRESTIGMVIGTVVNVVLDPVMIFLFKWGVVGAAVSTVLGNFIAFAYYAFIYARNKTLLHIRIKEIFDINLMFDKKLNKEIFMIGLPAGAGQMLITLSMIINNNIVKRFGVEAIAAYGIAFKLSLFAIFVFVGLSAGLQPLLGFAFGKKDYKRMYEINLKGNIIAIISGVIFFIAFAIFCKPIIQIFQTHADVHKTALIFFFAMIASWPFLGPELACLSTMQAAGKMKSSLILALSRQGILYVPIVLYLSHIFGIYGFAWAQFYTDIIVFIFAEFITFRFLLKKLKA